MSLIVNGFSKSFVQILQEHSASWPQQKSGRKTHLWDPLGKPYLTQNNKVFLSYVKYQPVDQLLIPVTMAVAKLFFPTGRSEAACRLDTGKKARINFREPAFLFLLQRNLTSVSYLLNAQRYWRVTLATSCFPGLIHLYFNYLKIINYRWCTPPWKLFSSWEERLIKPLYSGRSQTSGSQPS